MSIAALQARTATTWLACDVRGVSPAHLFRLQAALKASGVPLSHDNHGDRFYAVRVHPATGYRVAAKFIGDRVLLDYALCTVVSFDELLALVQPPSPVVCVL